MERFKCLAARWLKKCFPQKEPRRKLFETTRRAQPNAAMLFSISNQVKVRPFVSMYLSKANTASYVPQTNCLVTVQPAAAGSSETPNHLFDAPCVRGLENLQSAVQIKFKQELHMVQIFCCTDWNINFELIDEESRSILNVTEDANCCTMNCIPQGCRTHSVVSKMDNYPALYFKRESRCVFNCCLPCCCFPLLGSREQLSVTSAITNELLGVVRQDWSAWRSRFTVLDAAGNPALKIEGPGCNFACCSDIEFSILSLDGGKIGSLTKHFHFLKDVFTDFDDFTLKFPRDLDVATKATLLGAVNLINFLFFQGAIRRFLCVGCGICLNVNATVGL